MAVLPYGFLPLIYLLMFNDPVFDRDPAEYVHDKHGTDMIDDPHRGKGSHIKLTLAVQKIELKDHHDDIFGKDNVKKTNAVRHGKGYHEKYG